MALPTALNPVDPRTTRQVVTLPTYRVPGGIPIPTRTASHRDEVVAVAETASTIATDRHSDTSQSASTRTLNPSNSTRNRAQAL